MESVVIVLDNKQWVSENFQTCDLGDARRTKRLLKVAESHTGNRLATQRKAAIC